MLCPLNLKKLMAAFKAKGKNTHWCMKLKKKIARDFISSSGHLPKPQLLFYFRKKTKTEQNPQCSIP